MLTPSLRTLSGRRQATDRTGIQQAGPHTLIPHISANSADAATQKTESVHSDDALPPSSGIIPSAIPKFSLEESFPSILSTVEVMKTLETSKNFDGIRPLAPLFSSCLRTILRSMDVLPCEVRLNPAYEVAQYGVIFTENLFTGQISKISSSSKRSETFFVALEMVEMTISSLRSFLKIAERLVKESKPLPAVPTEFVQGECVVPSPAPLVNIVKEVLEAEDNTAGATSSHELDISHIADVSQTTDNSFEKKKKKLCRHSIIRRIVGHNSISSKASLFSYGTKSSVTLVNCDKAKPRRLPEPQFVLRQSALYYLADPYCPEIDVDMPVPTGDTAAVRLDQNGAIKAASVTALVRVLTSKDSVLDPEFTTTFFISFRFFMTPTRFYEELMERFNEQPSTNLSSAQLRIWARYAMGVHIRIGKALLMWLDLYWKPEVDCEVLEALQAFTLERLVPELPEGLVGQILQGLDSISGDEPMCRRIRKARDLEFVYHRSKAGAPSPGQSIEITLEEGLDVTTQLLMFNTPAGREEVARQLTLKLSELFQQVDPEDAVMHWHRANQNSEAGKTLQQIILLERALCLWITHTVLQQSSLRERRRFLEFWLDVATRCLRIRNFSGANCIFSGVSNSAIGRMRKTILDVGVPSKHQYEALESFLGGRDNYSDYRQALTLVEPTVPMIAPLIRDITSAMDVVPTSIGSTDECEDKNLVNFNSYRITSKTVRAMESCLIPYQFPKNDAFQAWTADCLAEFPPTQEPQIQDSFHNQSVTLEAKEPLLMQLRNPWSYTMTGSLDGVYTFHALPTPSNQFACFDTKSARRIPNFLKRA